MRSIWIIAKRELQSFFDSLIAYIMLVLFLGFSGFFTWLYGSDIFLVGQASMEVFFNIAFWTLFFFIPAITMRMLAEEKKTGTIELLLTKAVSDRQVVLGKFLACFLLVAISLAFTLPYYVTLANIGNVDHGAIWCGYLGLLLMSAAYISIGLFASSITNNQIVALLLALFIGLFFHIIFNVLSSSFSGLAGQLFYTLSLPVHFDSLSRGVIDSKDVIFFLSIILMGVLLAEMNLSKRNLPGKSNPAKSTKTRKSFYTSVILIIAILLLVNFLSTDYFIRFDLTQNQRYTLSEATEDIVSGLVEPVTVEAYFSENLPPNIARTRQDFKDLLIEYANISEGNLVYKFINPNKDEKTEQQALRAGISPVMINVREKDQVKQQKAFMGAVIGMGDRQEVIPFMQPEEAMEYALTTSLKKLAVTDKPSVGLIQGHGEPSTFEMPQAARELSVLYDFEDISLSDTTVVPERFKTLALIAPKDTLPDSHLARLDDFLKKGGNLLIALNKVEGSLQNATGRSVYTGLSPWLSKKGIEVENKFLIDANCGTITVQQQQGPFRIQSQVQFPFLPVINNFAQHPITTGLESVVLPFASPLVFSGDSALQYIPLAHSSEQSGTLEPPLYFNIEKQWSETDFPQSSKVVAAALKGKLAGNLLNKMVVISDGDFAVNARGGGQPQAVQPDNVSLFVNSIDWLSDDTGLIGLRTKSVTSRPIQQLKASTQTTLKWLNFAFPILLTIVIGVLRAQVRRRQRIKRMEVSYE